MSWAALKAIRLAVARRPGELAAERTHGRKVIGWIGYNVPEELIYACGMTPVRIAQGGDHRLSEIGSKYISNQNCHFLRHCIGLFAENNDSYIQQLDAVVTDTTCLQLHRMAQLLRHYFHVNVIELGFPRDPERNAGRIYFFAEIQHFVKRLEELAGAPLEEKKVQEAVQLYEKIGNAVRELYQLAASMDCRLRWRDVYEAVQSGYWLDRSVYLELLRELIREVNNDAVATVDQPLQPLKPRVLLAGSSMVVGDRKVIDVVEAAGAEIVGDLLWSGYAGYCGLTRKAATLEAIAVAYLDRLPHAAVPHMELDSDRRLHAIEDLAQSTKAAGVVYYSLRYCDPFSFKMQCTKDWLKCSGMRLVEVQTDYAAMDIETLRTRIEAFIEMLEVSR
jgi:benzoyl-CoA reductase/2-hydroxyglutaryl-CoA dehydratase subunit BcrC/BadD/HgdB